LFVANLLNRSNKGTPIGNLSSPQFGTSNSLLGISQFTFGASTAQSNRSVSLRVQFSFWSVCQLAGVLKARRICDLPEGG
jgi:hypothetical protein